MTKMIWELIFLLENYFITFENNKIKNEEL
jgi:hypothetical protein